MNTIKEVLMRRDGLSAEQADARVNEAKELLQDFLRDGDLESAEMVCEIEFGLEPDYIMELI